MPRTGRGGRQRSETQQGHPTGTDPNAPPPDIAAGTTEQGQRAEVEESLGMAPLPSAGPGPLPDDIPNLGDRSGAPGEPVTTGAKLGMGGGPEVLAATNADHSMRSELRALYAKHPTAGLRRLISRTSYGR